jgi:hypothetical protein
MPFALSNLMVMQNNFSVVEIVTGLKKYPGFVLIIIRLRLPAVLYREPAG